MLVTKKGYNGGCSDLAARVRIPGIKARPTPWGPKAKSRGLNWTEMDWSCA